MFLSKHSFDDVLMILF
jgi:PHS family inorganic phosphate transporter-like MFS transporter